MKIQINPLAAGLARGGLNRSLIVHFKLDSTWEEWV